MLRSSELVWNHAQWVGNALGWTALTFAVGGWIVECLGPEKGGIRLEESSDADHKGKGKGYQAVFHDDNEDNEDNEDHHQDLQNIDEEDVLQGDGSGSGSTMEEKLLIPDQRESPFLRAGLYSIMTFEWLSREFPPNALLFQLEWGRLSYMLLISSSFLQP